MRANGEYIDGAIITQAHAATRAQRDDMKREIAELKLRLEMVSELWRVDAARAASAEKALKAYESAYERMGFK